MKWFNVFLLIIFLMTSPVMAYQTVTMDFPGNWYKIKYLNNDRDGIVQFVRQGYNEKNWYESVVFHVFKWTKEKEITAKKLLLILLSDVQRKNNTMKVEYIKLDDDEAMATWCVKAIQNMPAHCELIRTTQSFEGAMSMHYINRDTENFHFVKNDWIERVSNAKVYQSYFRLDRILNKSLTFEL